MRLLVVGINYAPDVIGVAKYTTELCEGLAARGHELQVITAPPYYPQWQIPAEYRSSWYSSEALHDVIVTRAPIYVPEQPSGSKRLLHHASYLVSSCGPLLSKMAFWRPDVVLSVAPSLLSASAAIVAARMFGARSWLHVQDLEIDAAFELGLLKNAALQSALLGFERTVIRAFDRVSTISPQMVQRLLQKGLSADRLRELRNWVDTSMIVPASRQTSFRTELGLNPTDIVALYSGAMSNKQGLELVLQAAAATHETHPEIKYLLCGNGPHKERLLQAAACLGNVHFLDLQPVERLPELLSTADIHLLPQLAQAADLVMPSKLAGMLASGRPIVAMASAGSGIASEVNGAGLIAQPGDAHELAEAVKSLAINDALRARLGDTARRRAEQNWDRVAIINTFEHELSLLSAFGRAQSDAPPVRPAAAPANSNIRTR
ncbi:glycosyltransferase WbuB [Bradyrhizobium sp. WSM3983]|uniref:glycosyltransferase WbuB n=1 Tax=Bradyrhizobium sp. WSM3983 TaxID=1038867 RepID=UPI000405287E|nr:glycosyltransferase WbuB [Bradyrhizobium sp. WSM3983]